MVGLWRAGVVWCGVIRRVGAEGSLGGPSGLVRQAGVRGVALSRGLCLGPGVFSALWGSSSPGVRPGWGGVTPCAWLVPLPFACLSASVSSPVLGVVALSPFLPWCQCPYIRVVAPAAQGGRGPRLAVRVRCWFLWCSRWWLCGGGWCLG